MCEAASSYYCNLDCIQMEKAANVYSSDRLKWKLVLYVAELAFWACLLLTVVVALYILKQIRPYLY